MIDLPLVIIAGGKSSRMGSDKALLPFDTFKTLTQFQLARFKEHFSSVSISCKSKDKFDFDAFFIEDDPYYAESSPLVALLSILNRFETPVCVLSVDTPFVAPNIFATLQEHMRTIDDAIVAKSSFGNHPLCAIYRPLIQEKILMMLEANDHKIGHLLQSISTQYVDFGDDAPFYNLNYLKEYEDAKKRLASMATSHRVDTPTSH